MKNVSLQFGITLLCLMTITSCKKSGSATSGNSSVITGFWTFKEDPAQDYWNSNVWFKSDGTAWMYTAFSLADTSAGPAIADTAGQTGIFGKYTVSGSTVKINFTEFGSIGLSFEGTLNSSNNILKGNIGVNAPGSASPVWYLTKP